MFVKSGVHIVFVMSGVYLDCVCDVRCTSGVVFVMSGVHLGLCL